jgi:hypothetical protein
MEGTITPHLSQKALFFLELKMNCLYDVGTCPNVFYKMLHANIHEKHEKPSSSVVCFSAVVYSSAYWMCDAGLKCPKLVAAKERIDLC